MLATHSFDYGYDGKMISIGADDMYFTMPDNNRNFPYVIQGTGVVFCRRHVSVDTCSD